MCCEIGEADDDRLLIVVSQITRGIFLHRVQCNCYRCSHRLIVLSDCNSNSGSSEDVSF